MGRLRLLRNQAEFLADLHRLCSSFGAEFIKQPAGMGLYGVFADEEFFGNLPVAHAVCDQLEYFQLAGRNRKLAQFSFIQDKGRGG